MPTVHVHFLPSLVEPRQLAGGTTIVIDVLRATTTIVHSLAAGARQVAVCREVDDARRLAESLPAGSCLLAGERGGLKIPGFDLGNSPAEFTPDVVSGKVVVLTTTNGTQALAHARHADRVLVGAAVNFRAVFRSAAASERVDLLCAGTDGHITLEDVLVAGAIVDMLAQPFDLANDEAFMARATWRERVAARVACAGSLDGALAEAMRGSLGGRNLIALGMNADIADAARLDRFDLVPRFDPASMRVEPK